MNTAKLFQPLTGLFVFGLSQGVQKRLAGHPSQCRPVAALHDLYQRELRPQWSRDWGTHSSVSGKTLVYSILFPCLCVMWQQKLSTLKIWPIKYLKDHANETTNGIRFTIFLFSIISAYEHAVLAAGTDFRSDRLWESFVNWETEQQKLANVTAIYDRILGIPTQLYSQHFQR